MKSHVVGSLVLGSNKSQSPHVHVNKDVALHDFSSVVVIAYLSHHHNNSKSKGYQKNIRATTRVASGNIFGLPHTLGFRVDMYVGEGKKREQGTCNGVVI